MARKLGEEWKRFAIHLGLGHTSIQQADREQSLEDKAFNILVAWKKGMGSRPKSWDTILTALESAELSDLASEVKANTGQGAIYSFLH